MRRRDALEVSGAAAIGGVSPAGGLPIGTASAQATFGPSLIRAPASMSADIIRKFNAEVVEIGKSAKMRAALTRPSVDLPFLTPAGMLDFRKEDIALNAEVIKAAKVKLE